MTCLDPQYRNVIQCQNIVYVLNEHEILQPKLRMLKGLRDGNDYDINDTRNDIIEELIHKETDAIVINEDVTQTKVQIEPSPHSL